MSIDSTATPVDELAVRVVEDALRSGLQVLPEHVGKMLLAAAGITVPAGVEVADVDEVPAELTGPWAVKAVSTTLVHKTDAGGVRIGVAREQLAEATAAIRASLAEAGHACEGFLVEQMAPKGEEVVVGAVRTEGLGWAVMVGLGGVFVEVLEDVAFGVAPITRDQAGAMLAELRGLPLLQGARGRTPVSTDALVDVIVRLAGADGLLEALPAQVREIDLNPVIVSPDGAVAVDARFVLDADAEDDEVGHEVRGAADLGPLFEPRRIAVLGASAKGTNGGTLFIRNLLGYGFPGTIVPIHPSAESIEGIAAVPSLAEAGDIDYAYVALPAGAVADSLAAAGGRLRFAQVISSGFAETEEGIGLERDLVSRMRALGTRVIGPNCLGTHSTRGRITFVPDAPKEVGGVAVLSQSGGLSVDILRLGEARGVAFHSVTSIGNSADLTAAEMLEFLLDSPDTRVVGLYLESLASGRAVLDVLSRRPDAKPVVLLAGGRTADGSRAATSHTGALSGHHRLWPALARQAGMELVDTLGDFVNVLATMDLLDGGYPVENNEVVLFGNGGGASVLAADAMQRCGLTTPRLPEATIAHLDGLGLPPGNGLANPIDAPAPTLAVDGGAVAKDILGAVLDATRPAAVISHFNVGIIQRNMGATHGDVTGTLIDAIAAARDAGPAPCHHLMVLKADGKADMEAQIRDYALRARERGFPVFAELEEAAVVARALVRRGRRAAATPH
ncbi:CoA-binding protein [Nocardioides albidus]|uniref:CoA-binding protein n=1 Tax=Nocardioides albidus TaxID=1517589 RepID=A0A5C4WS38_9ACTN|nr:acetate--CoA ligase family protein [Nocardioides albidus]TNM50802.1 CoA-binding protein [Nocardioides albidus]